MRAQEHHRRDSPFPFLVPPGWRAGAPPGAGSVVFTARAEAAPPSGVVPGLVLLREPVTSPVDWAAAAEERLRTGLTEFELEDEDDFEGRSGPVTYRRIGHRIDGRDVVSDQWTWLVGDVAHVLTGTVGLAEYLAHCDLFESVAGAYDADLARTSGSRLRAAS